QTGPGALTQGWRNVSRNGAMDTSTSRFDVVILNGFAPTTVIGGSVQFLMTVKEAFVLNAVPLGSIRMRATLASRMSSFTTAVWQVKVSSLRELLNHEVTLPGSAAAMRGNPRRTPNRSVTVG